MTPCQIDFICIWEENCSQLEDKQNQTPCPAARSYGCRITRLTSIYESRPLSFALTTTSRIVQSVTNANPTRRAMPVTKPAWCTAYGRLYASVTGLLNGSGGRYCLPTGSRCRQCWRLVQGEGQWVGSTDPTIPAPVTRQLALHPTSCLAPRSTCISGTYLLYCSPSTHQHESLPSSVHDTRFKSSACRHTGVENGGRCTFAIPSINVPLAPSPLPYPSPADPAP